MLPLSPFPWQERPAGSSELLWRCTANPLTGHRPIPGVLGIYNSAVVPWQGAYVGVFRGDRTDRMFDYLPYDNTPSRWGGIRLKASSQDNRFSYVDIHSASYGIACDSAATDATKLTLENSILHNIGGEGLGLYHCRAIVANTQISNTLGHCVAVVGGWAEFVHCTLAQFYCPLEPSARYVRLVVTGSSTSSAAAEAIAGGKLWAYISPDVQVPI